MKIKQAIKTAYGMKVVTSDDKCLYFFSHKQKFGPLEEKPLNEFVYFHTLINFHSHSLINMDGLESEAVSIGRNFSLAPLHALVYANEISPKAQFVSHVGKVDALKGMQVATLTEGYAILDDETKYIICADSTPDCEVFRIRLKHKTRNGVRGQFIVAARSMEEAFAKAAKYALNNGTGFALSKEDYARLPEDEKNYWLLADWKETIYVFPVDIIDNLSEAV